MVTFNLSADATDGDIDTVRQGLVDVLSGFFAEHSGKVLGVKQAQRRNSQARTSVGDAYQGITVHVQLENVAIFGEDGDYLSDVYPRIRYLNSRLRDHLRGVDLSSVPELGRAATIMPYPSPNGHRGRPLPREEYSSHGERIASIGELAAHNDHWRDVKDRYGAEFVCITNNDTVVGPDISELATARAVADTTPGRLRVYEFGSGTGTLATMLDRQAKLASYEGVDFAWQMVDHFDANVRPRLAHLRTPAAVAWCSCMESSLPHEVDLVCVTVYYQAQPSLIRRRGEEIARCLGDSGVLMAQTGMLEDPLVTALLAGGPSEVRHWPWYDPGFSLKTWFRFVEEAIVERQAVVLASNDAERLAAVIGSLASNGRLQQPNGSEDRWWL